MLTLLADPPDPADLLFEARLEPAPPAEHKGPENSAALETVRGKRNVVQIGKPQLVDVLAGWPFNERLDPEIEAAREHFDFTCVRLAASFVPDRGCRFVWARFVIALTAIPPAGAPLAADMFPREVVTSQAYKRSFGITPGAKLAFAEVSAELSTDRETLRYEPRLIGAGLLTDEPSWTVQGSTALGIQGIVETFLLVKRPRGTPLHTRFSVAAEVQTAWGRIPLRHYSNDRLLDRTWTLIS
jgi:hypothetical protein